MLEDIAGTLRSAGAEQQPARLEPTQRGAQCGFVKCQHGSEQLAGEPPPDAGADLCHLTHGRCAVEPRHQTVLQRRGNCHFRKRAADTVGIFRLDDQAALENGLGQLFHEERNSVGLGNDLLEHFSRQGLSADHFLGHQHDIPSRQTDDRQSQRMCETRPRRPVFGAIGGRHQDALVRDVGQKHVQDFLRGRVDPVRVLHDQEHGLSGRKCKELTGDRP